MKISKLIRTLSIVLIIAILIGTALYFIPWPTRIQTEFNCVLIYADGTEKFVGEISVDGWCFDYIFKDTKLDIDIALPDGYGWDQPENHNDNFLYNELWPIFEGVPYLVSVSPLLSGSPNLEFDHSFYAFSVDDGKFILWNKSNPDAPYLVGSNEADCDTADIMEYFSVFIEVCEGFAE